MTGALLGIALPSQALGAPRVHLQLEDASDSTGCISAPDLEKQVEARLGRRVFTDRPGELRLALKLARIGGTWSAKLTLSDPMGILGQRELRSRGKHCSSLDDSLALVVALLVDTPTAPPSEPVPEAKPPKGPEAPSISGGKTAADPRQSADRARAAPSRPTTGEPTPLTLPADTPARREPWQFEIGAHLLLTAGALPGLAPGGELAFSASAPRAPEVRLSLDAYRSESASVVDRDAGARFFLARVGLEVCGNVLTGERWALRTCAGQHLGRLSAAGYGFDQNVSRARVLDAVGGSVEGTLRASERLKFALAARVELPLQREKFIWRNETGTTDSVFEQAWAFLAVKMGLRWSP
ncbi:MAG TPA: hypothetical protein VFQ61_09795 [Polyangiaceae bacterium]|nr:hypothetical protein [Polyangiaceae bacterium]